MIVALDGSCLATPRATGVERSFLLTLEAFAANGHRCIVHVPFGCRHALPPSVERRPIPRIPLFVWREHLLPLELGRARPDVWLSPTTALPPRAPCPRIGTVHELPERRELSAQGTEIQSILRLRGRGDYGVV